MKADPHPSKPWAVRRSQAVLDCLCSQVPDSQHSVGPKWILSGWINECAWISAFEDSFNMCLCLSCFVNSLATYLMAVDLVSWKGHDCVGSSVWKSPDGTWETHLPHHPQLCRPYQPGQALALHSGGFEIQTKHMVFAHDLAVFMFLNNLFFILLQNNTCLFGKTRQAKIKQKSFINP